MQLKIKRSQREGGMMAKSVIFCLDARVEFSPAEAANIKRYRLQDQLSYSSEAAKAAAMGSAAAAANARGGRLSVNSMDDVLSSATSQIGHGLKAVALGALASMKLNITIASLQRGQHIECKSLDELLGAEEAIMSACENLKGYLETAATFDGREVLIDFSTDRPEIVAQAVAPSPQLVAPSVQPLHRTAAAAPTIEPQPSMAGTAALVAQGDDDFFHDLKQAWYGVDEKQRRAILIVGGILLVIFIGTIIF
jgi:hypothetical protein